MKKIFIILGLTVLYTNIYAQKEANWWYFGYGAGLNFNTTRVVDGYTVPTSVTGPVSTYEGCFSISNPITGQFLMASDGMKVYNGPLATNVVENGSGLHGNPSATQSGIIVPRPGNLNKYYIMTVDAIASAGGNGYGLKYSELDMSLNAGKGKVTSKNIQIEAGLYENIATIQNKDGVNYWLIHRSPTHFIVWEVTKDGVNLTPKHRISAGYALNPADGPQLPGYLKISPDGRLIAHAGGSSGRIVMGEFDTATGEITNVLVNNVGELLYGLEFSPSGNYLYVSGTNNLFKYPTATFSTATPVKLVAGAVNRFRSMQLAPDNKIFIASNTAKDIHFIPNPEDESTTAIKIHTLTNYLTGAAHSWGLPTFVNSFFSIDNSLEVSSVPVCTDREETYSVDVIRGTGTSRIEFIKWDFGDGSPTVDDNDWAQVKHSLQHKYEKEGVYTVTLIPYRDVAGTDPITGKIAKFDVTVKPCMLPVNPNIHQYKQ